MAKTNDKKSKKKKIIFGGLGALLLIIIVLVIVSGNKEDITSVQTEKITKRTITQIVRATGKIHPIEQVILRAEVTGEIVELPVKEGDKVKRGQLLVRLKPEQYVARRNMALASLNSSKANLSVREANLIQVEAEYKRVQGLFDKNLASDKDLEIAKANYLQSKGGYESQKAMVSQAEESYKDAEVELSKTAVYAPIDGIVTQRPIELSERVNGSSFSPGTHLLTVADLNQIETRINVNENDIVNISIGDTSKIEIDAFANRIFKGIVTQIGNSAISTGLTTDQVVNFEVRIKLVELDEKIRPGMSCNADIETETKVNVLTVPIQSVTARLDKSKSTEKKEGEDSEEGVTNGALEKKKEKPKEVVFIVKDNTAKMVEVETGISNDDYYEIIKGLSGDETIISGPYRAVSKDLEDGSKIILQNKTSKTKK